MLPSGNGGWNATCIEAFSETTQAWYEVRVYPIIPGLIVMFVDITARKQLELSLQASEARFRALSTAAFEGVIIHDTNVVIDANEAAVALYGYRDVHGLIGQPIRALITPDCWNAVHQHMASGSEDVYECTAVRSDGSTFPIEARASWTTYGDKQVRIGTFRDLTEHKRAEAQRIQLEKRESVSRLARGIAHDFSTLLTVISLGSEEILSQVSHDEALVADMEAIRHAAEQAVALTRQLSALSRDDTRTHTPVYLSRVVAAMECMLHRLLGAHITYEAHLDEQLCPILADASQLEQVVLNLVINARDAMPDGGHLRITTTQVDAAPKAGGVGPAQATDATCVQLVVQDTGMGMDADTQAQIFEPFFTTKPPGRGTGLGLAIIHAIVLQCGGSIHVISAPGQGTCFTITFPTNGDSWSTGATHRSSLTALSQSSMPPLSLPTNVPSRPIVGSMVNDWPITPHNEGI